MLDFFYCCFILFLIIFVMVGVAFLTLLERRVLGYIHIRKGPNKVGFVGILQPFRDAIRLCTREPPCLKNQPRRPTDQQMNT